MATAKRSLAVTEFENLKVGIPIDPEFNRPKLVVDREELKQAIKLRLIELKGDWFFDPDFGIPWIDNREFGIAGVLGTKPSMPEPLIEAFIRDELDKEFRIKSVRNMLIEIDELQRSVSIEFDVDPIEFPPFRIETVI